MKRESATEIGQDVLVWLAGRPEDLERLLALSGVDPAGLRAGASDPDFLGFVLDFLLQSDDLVLAFAREAGITPDLPARARAALPGGDVPNWT